MTFIVLVVDGSGAGISGVNVTMVFVASNRTATAVTDATGKASPAAVYPSDVGQVNVTAVYNGATKTATGVLDASGNGQATITYGNGSAIPFMLIFATVGMGIAFYYLLKAVR